MRERSDTWHEMRRINKSLSEKFTPKITDKKYPRMKVKMTDKKYPRVGVAVIIQDEETKILLGLRKISHGAGTWGLPGGHLEWGESVADCAIREVLEETGLEIEVYSPRERSQKWTNDFFEEENKHYITIFQYAKVIDGYLSIKEPEKCAEWRFFSWEELRDSKLNLFLSMKNFIKLHWPLKETLRAPKGGGYHTCPHCSTKVDLTRNYKNEIIIPLHGEGNGDAFEKCKGSYEVTEG